MENLKRLIKEGKLAESLIADKKFCEKAKEIFREKNIKITDENLINVIKNAEKSLKGNKYLTEDDLGKIAGGINNEEFEKNLKLFIAISGAITGAMLGAVAGFLGGMNFGPDIATIGMSAPPEDYFSKEAIKYEGREIRGAFTGAAIGTGAGMAGGAYLGYRLASLIANKYVVLKHIDSEEF